jgi:hypothetical protein
MSNIIAIPLNKLTRSARNVRKSGGDSIDDLTTSILVHGLIHNLTVVEQQADNGENSGKWVLGSSGAENRFKEPSRFLRDHPHQTEKIVRRARNSEEQFPTDSAHARKRGRRKKCIRLTSCRQKGALMKFYDVALAQGVHDKVYRGRNAHC